VRPNGRAPTRLEGPSPTSATRESHERSESYWRESDEPRSGEFYIEVRCSDMKLAALAMLPLLLLAQADPLAQTPAQPPPKTPAPPSAKTPPTQTPDNQTTTKPATPRPRPAAPAQPASTVATVTVTDRSGAPIAEVDVSLTGLLDRFGSTQPNGVVKFDGLRPGIYRLRFEKEGYNVLEREFEVRAGQPAPNPTVTLSPAPPKPAPPPPPEPQQKPPPLLPPPGKPTAVAMPDFIEKNFITNSQPQKVTSVACSGVASTMLWQVREPWLDREHESAEAMLYVVGGEGTIRIDGRDTPLRAGSFASVPRGTSYSLTRNGRNPLVVLATLAGEPCTQ
jgi:mannose-6-phosphate isomerase-like protein (cupin superfamily)